MKKIKQQEIMQRYIASRSRDIYIYMECSHLLKHSEKPDQSVRIPRNLKTMWT
ncbi:hypothetical protein [Dubosiella newyorkensis]|uniref:hypothetical protein n=1 Tax=Dubosiella newyorkensis TaxID=1862672 RepID=UPI0013010AF8|nr:hypothetical protein [Dubosiella newyorkensis]